jgi:hypothetical protein
MSTSTTSNFTENVIKAIEALLNALRVEGTKKWADIEKAEKILTKLRAESPDDPIDREGGPIGGFRQPPGEGGDAERPGSNHVIAKSIDREGGPIGGTHPPPKIGKGGGVEPNPITSEEETEPAQR